MRWWPPVLTGLAGVALTLGLLLWFDIQDARSRIKPEPEAPEPATVSFGADARALSNADIVVPFERYVLHGETQWLPLVLQLGDPEFLEGDKQACISLLSAMPDDARCRAEYSFWLDPIQAGRVLGIEALVPSGDASCRAYVECRLPGLASARLDVPASELNKHPSGLRITDKVTHAKHRHGVEDEQREIEQLTALLATPDHPDLVLMPPEAQRLQHFRRQRQAHLLKVLNRRKQRR
ncbi:MAG: hypothetical protein H0T76_19290 [Nannocystis sp.]|nr:hypothetical protein [Nannocystis sp.]MBA3548635.1 hypothetical protein [Nannocystis sp.]